MLVSSARRSRTPALPRSGWKRSRWPNSESLKPFGISSAGRLPCAWLGRPAFWLMAPDVLLMGAGSPSPNNSGLLVVARNAQVRATSASDSAGAFQEPAR